ncbi:MAG: CotH kinase family protein [Bacteroides sp.]|nr:CotH kinase family protein [Bacteroides sp.]MCM1378791.1 CotH kinase family protein [Bacteroides sp.]MCM1445408.1 CotH kinase family protein [Prevotella sp.]
MASGTIPTLHIRTENGDSILDKVTKIPAGLFVTVPADCELPALGSELSPVALTIRGRGNATWTLAKKPYKLKFAEKTSVLGLPANRDFALIAWNFGSGNIEWITSVCAMEMARMLGMLWAPHIQPVELILNGNYEGLYFLTETVKVSKNRLNIYEQPDLNDDPATIPYGWLVEFDNYYEEQQIVIPEIGSLKLRVTAHTPGEMSAAQRQWLTEEFELLNCLVYSTDKEAWTQRIDVESAVQYFIMREVMFDTDGYSGSIFLHRDRGSDVKWHFGPMWDPVLNVSTKTGFTMNKLPSFAVAHWERQLLASNTFKEEFLRQWEEFYPDKFNRLKDIAHRVADYCEAADAANAVRWPQLSVASSAGAKAKLYWQRISAYAAWLDEHKNLTDDDLSAITEIAAERPLVEVYDLMGRRVASPRRGKIYICGGKKIVF